MITGCSFVKQLFQTAVLLVFVQQTYLFLVQQLDRLTVNACTMAGVLCIFNVATVRMCGDWR